MYVHGNGPAKLERLMTKKTEEIAQEANIQGHHMTWGGFQRLELLK